MNNNVENLFFNFGQKIINYLPNLLAGFVLLIVGWFVGWFIKRITIQLLRVLRFERLLLRFRWGGGLSKADIRYALFNFIGNIVFFLIFLIFLNSALDAMQLTVLSHLIEGGVLFFPKLFVALIILLIGWIIAGRVSLAVFNALIKENFPHYSLISRFVKFILLIFFSAMALIELNIAAEIVVIGFTTIIITLSLMAIIFAVSRKNSWLSEFFNPKKDSD